jgi:hypothetical protein
MAADPSSMNGWERLLFGAIGVVVGFLLNEGKNLFVRRRKHRAYWAALWTEVEYARGRSHMYVNDKIMAPLYRLPIKAFESCYPELLADGVVTQAEATALMAFYTEVETFNRGLDRVGDAPDDAAMRNEYSRNLLKAQQLLTNGSLYSAVAVCLRPHVADA